MRSRRLVIAVLVVVLGLAFDLARPPSSQLTTKAALAAIDLYQATLSKALARAGGRCRFKPTCSNYGEYAIRQHGLVKGGWMTVGRIFRCGPWTPMGTWDPPPGTTLEKLAPPRPPDPVPSDPEPPSDKS